MYVFIEIIILLFYYWILFEWYYIISSVVREVIEKIKIKYKRYYKLSVYRIRGSRDEGRLFLMKGLEKVLFELSYRSMSRFLLGIKKGRYDRSRNVIN